MSDCSSMFIINLEKSNVHSIDVGKRKIEMKK